MSTPGIDRSTETALDIAWVRAQFPSLQTQVNGQPAAFLDGPAGTQVPTQVMHAIQSYLMNANANTSGAFLTSRRTNEMIAGNGPPASLGLTEEEVFGLFDIQARPHRK